MTKIYIIKLSSDLDNKEPFQASCSSYLKAWNSLDSDNEEEDQIDTDGPDSGYSYMLEIMSSLVCSLWKKRQLHISTDFALTGCLLCVIHLIL